MNVNIEELITLNYELEGLLHLALHRGNATPPQVWDLIAAKIDALKEGLPAKNDKNIDNSGFTDEPTPETELHIDTVEEIHAEVEENNTDIEDTLTETEENNTGIEDTLTETEENNADIEDTPTETEEDEVNKENYSDLKPLPIPKEAESPCLTDDEIKTVIKEEELEAAEADPMEEPSFSAPESGYVPYTESSIPQNRPSVSEPIRLDEKLARENSRNLRKAFSLNDKFRFRRELFSNSDILMNETLDAIEAMSSINEATDYFYTDLKWDKSNQDVIDFVEIITHHFSGK
ncbi:MAG: hypothetical protein HDS41_00500 [Bacteroides sp.]|nr:hypothetical protein [Bacteroides sp.]